MAMYSVGVSALQAAQKALEVTGHNIANANTPGYHRQIPKLASQPAMSVDGKAMGRGVELVDIQRAVNQELEASLTRQVTKNGSVDLQLRTMTRLESRWSTEGASPAGRLEALFNDLEQLSTRLNDRAQRKVAIATAVSTAREFNSLSTDLYDMRQDIDRSMIGVANEINPLVRNIARFNDEIQRQIGQGITPNDLLDKRGVLINDLAKRIPIEVQNGEQGQVTILTAGTPLVIAASSQEIVMDVGSSGNSRLVVASTGTELDVSSGQFGGLIHLRNNVLMKYHSRLDDLARAVIREFDSIQATGVGMQGGFTQLNGHRGAKDVTAKLAASGLPFPPTAGSLFVTTTEIATGQRTITEVAIDPSAQTLDDVARSLSNTVPHFSAYVNHEVGTLSMSSAPGYEFDFTGGFDSNMTATIGGGTTTTAVPGGVLTGNTNDVYTVTFQSSGTVGVTAGLQARVTNRSGTTLTTLNLGQGYEAGKPMLVANGVTMSFTPGNVVAGDSFAVKVVGRPDTSGLLSALGLNTFFTGDDASTMKVNVDLLDHPERLATSRTGEPGDASNLHRMLALRDASVLNDNTQTFAKAFNLSVADIGTEVGALQQLNETNQLLTERIETEIQSESGVDSNEEMVEILKYQQMFQMAAKYVNTVSDTFDELLKLQQ